MGKLIVLMFTAFVDMVGSTMILPLIPFYATRMGANGAMLGVILASYAVAQLVSAEVRPPAAEAVVEAREHLAGIDGRGST